MRLAVLFRSWRCVVAAVALGWSAVCGPAHAGSLPLVFAAASLKTALDRIAGDWQAGGAGKVRFAYAGTAGLVRQLEHGAPADILMAADIAWMNYAETRKLIARDTRRNLLGNSLVLVAPRASDVSVNLARPGSIVAALKGGRLAIGNVASVPAGRYARQALERLGHWQGVAGQLAQGENVRAVLALVARGEAPLGIVYATDARAEPRVRVAAKFLSDSHPPIVYTMALTAGSKSKAARAFFDYLQSGAAARRFAAEGFWVLK